MVEKNSTGISEKSASGARVGVGWVLTNETQLGFGAGPLTAEILSS